MADITTLAQLKTWATGGGSSSIAPGTYTLDSDILVRTDGTLTHDGTAGDVIIDGDDAFEFKLYPNAADITLSFDGLSDTQRFMFKKGQWDSIAINPLSYAITATFNYCHFFEAFQLNGMTVYANGDAGVVKVTCNNCKAYDNYNDGFSISGTGNTYQKTIILNNSPSYSNGTDGVAASGDGITAHDEKQRFIVFGGEYYDNGKTAASINGGAEFYCYGGTEFYDNGKYQSAFEWDVYLDASFGVIVEAVFKDDGVATYNGPNVLSRRYIDFQNGAKIFVLNCTFEEIAIAGDYNKKCYVYLSASSADVHAYFSGCTFAKSPSLWNFIGLYENGGYHVSGMFENCVFYDAAYLVVNIYSPTLCFRKNIFVDNNIALYCQSAGIYSENPLNGYNVFYNNNTILSGDGGSVQATDMTAIDPQLADPDNGDFRVRNPGVLYGGGADVHGRNQLIGAVTPLHGTRPVNVNGRFNQFAHGWRI